MSIWRRSAFSTALSWIVVGILGAAEGIYGRTQYLADWISYLNVSRAIDALDWKGIFDPMWNPGYPALIALVRHLFSSTPEGEWYAIFLLNWIIFFGAYAAFRYLIRQAIRFYDPAMEGLASRPALTWVSCFIFLAFGLCFDQVSRVSPDLLVTVLFMLSVAQILRLTARPALRDAVLLGVILGAGCWVKCVFVSFSGIFLVVFAAACLLRKISIRIPAITAMTFAVIWLPYVALISWSYGQLTLGVSGPLNYAFHVNMLPHWANWQGGPAEFGKPLHASTPLLRDLPAFGFKAPFHTTYPPFNNMAYWYQGYHPFFSLKNQVIAIGRSFYFFARIAIVHPFLYAFGLVLLAIGVKSEWRRAFLKMAKKYWPAWVPAAIGFVSYMTVHVEDRYLSCFFLIFSLLALTPLLDKGLQAKRSLAVFVIAVLIVGSAAEVTVNARRAFKGALHGKDFHSDPQWVVAKVLEQDGLRRGDMVAVIGGKEPTMRSSWAYVAGLRIVAEFGTLPWRLQPASRTWFERAESEQADENYAQVFWGLRPDQRARVMQAFQETGARAIVCFASPGSDTDPGWERAGQTDAWIYRFGPTATEPAQAALLREATSR